MDPEKMEKDYEKVITNYYGKDAVTAIITLKVDTKEADAIASTLSQFDNIEDVFLVTGDTDIITKVHFESYAALKNFVLDEMAKIDGIKDTKTLMVVSSYKQRGVRIQE